MASCLLKIGQTNEAYIGQTERLIKESLRALEVELEEVTEQTAALLLRQRQLVEAIDRYKVAIAPHKKLPNDILRYIFTLCCDTKTSFPLRRGNTQLSLCAVCSTWRRIALDAPHLWKEVIIDICSLPYNAPIAIAQSWLARAGNLSRSLTLTTSGYERSEEMTLLTQLLFAYPYRKIHLTLGSEQLFQQIMVGLPLNTLSHLEELKMSFNSLGYLVRDPYGDSLPLLFDPSTHFPNLTSLRLFDSRWNYQLLETGIVSWHTLRQLSVDSFMPASLCFEILRKGSSLNSCYLEVEAEPTFVTTYPAFTESLLTSDVQYLSLKFQNEIAAEPFIHLLVLPAILELELFAFNSRTKLGFTAAELACMAHRSQMKDIKYLHVGNCDSPLDIASMLQSVPSLRELMVHGEAMLDDQALQELGAGKLGCNLSAIITNDRGFSSRLEQVTALRKITAKNNSKIPVLTVNLQVF